MWGGYRSRLQFRNFGLLWALDPQTRELLVAKCLRLASAGNGGTTRAIVPHGFTGPARQLPRVAREHLFFRFRQPVDAAQSLENFRMHGRGWL